MVAMNLRKRAAFFSSFPRGACLALLTTSAALHLRRPSSALSSFYVAPVVTSSVAAMGTMVAIAGATAEDVGAAVIGGTGVCSSLLRGNLETFRGGGTLAVSLVNLRAAAAATVLAAYKLSAQALHALAQSSDKAAAEGTPEPSPAGETFLTNFFRHFGSVEMPTFSAAVSRGVDRIASAVLIHFFPEAQLPQEEPSSPGSVFWREEGSPTPQATVAATTAAAGQNEGGPEAVAATGRSPTGATFKDVETQPTARAPTAAAAAPAGARVRAPLSERCRSRNSGSSSSNPSGSAGSNIPSFSALRREESSPQSAVEDSILKSSWAPPPSSSYSSHTLSSPMSSRAASQGQRVCPDAARQHDRCTSPTSEAAPETLSSSRSATPAGKKKAEFLLGSTTAARDGRPVDSAAAAAPFVGDGQSEPRLHVAGGAAGRRALTDSALPSSAPAVGGGEDQSGTALPSTGAAAGERLAKFAFTFEGGEGLPAGEVELSESFFERPDKAGFSPISPFTMDIAGVREFLSSVDFLDPLLLALLGFHLLLLAGTICCRRMHTVQLLLMSLVSTLLLCSKQLLLLCSLVEQRLRTDDSLASAVAAFSSTPPSSSRLSSASTASQFYCCPSAAERTTLFLLLFWWLPLFAALSLLVGTLVQELVTSTLLLATRKAKVTKRRLRARDETGALTAVPEASPPAASVGGSRAKM